MKNENGLMDELMSIGGSGFGSTPNAAPVDQSGTSKETPKVTQEEGNQQVGTEEPKKEEPVIGEEVKKEEPAKVDDPKASTKEGDEKKTEEPVKDTTDFYDDFQIEVPEENVEKPTKESSVAATPEDGQQLNTQFLNNLEKEIGGDVKFSSQEDLVSHVKSLQEQANIVKRLGIDETVMEALDSGLIEIEEVLNQNLLVEYGDGMRDAQIVEDMILSENPDATEEEISEKIEALRSNGILGVTAQQYKNHMKTQRQLAMRDLKGKVQEYQNSQQAALDAQKPEVDAYKEQSLKLSEAIDKYLPEMQEVRGTGFQLEQKHRDIISQALKNPEILKRALFGNDLSNPNIEQAANKVAFMLMGKSMINAVKQQAASATRKELIEGESNITLKDPKGAAITKGNQRPAGVSHASAEAARVWAELGY